MRITANTLGLFLVVAGEPLLEILADGTGISEQNRPTGFANVSQLTDAEKAAFEYALDRYYSGQAAADAMKANLPYWTKQPREATDVPDITAYKDACDMRNATDAETFERVLTTGKYDTPATEVSVSMAPASKPGAPVVEEKSALEAAPPALPALAAQVKPVERAPKTPESTTTAAASAPVSSAPVATQPIVDGQHVSNEVAASAAAKKADEHPATSRLVELVTIVKKDLTATGHWALLEIEAIAHRL